MLKKIFFCFSRVVGAPMKQEIVAVIVEGVLPGQEDILNNEKTLVHDDASKSDPVKEPDTLQHEDTLLPSSLADDAATLADDAATPSDEVCCDLCQNVPCLLRQGLYDLITEYEDQIRQTDSDETLTNKEVRFKLYRHATTWMHGYLGKRRRIEIPQCIRTEILDLAPESSGSYAGFKDAADD
jgi:hypothetical protein